MYYDFYSLDGRLLEQLRDYSPDQIYDLGRYYNIPEEIIQSVIDRLEITPDYALNGAQELISDQTMVTPSPEVETPSEAPEEDFEAITEPPLTQAGFASTESKNWISWIVLGAIIVMIFSFRR